MALTDAQQNQLLANVSNIYQGLFQGAQVKVDGKVQTFNYGVLPIVANSQTMIAALQTALATLATAQGLDPAALQTVIETAVTKAVTDSVKALTITTTVS